MFLKGKYIKLENHQIEPVIKILYGLGYIWNCRISYIDIVRKLYNRNIYGVYIYEINDSELDWVDIDIHISKIREYIDVDLVKLIREYKLKRILK